MDSRSTPSREQVVHGIDRDKAGMVLYYGFLMFFTPMYVGAELTFVALC